MEVCSPSVVHVIIHNRDVHKYNVQATLTHPPITTPASSCTHINISECVNRRVLWEKGKRWNLSNIVNGTLCAKDNDFAKWTMHIT
eukprot:m.112033 g.112033  ORF g.112033 m.112033 type:complete len:86 (-) comp13468_c1_seq1:258-515(-)